MIGVSPRPEDGAPRARSDLRLVAVDHRSVVLHRVFVERYAELVRLATLLVKPAAAAEEVVSEAFARTYAAWDRIENTTDVYGYLRTVVVNLSRQNMRHRAVVARHIPDPVGDAAPAEVVVLAGLRSQELFAALDQLPRRQRECVVLRYYQGCSLEETAAILGIGVGSVKTHVHRGCARLAALLTPDEPGSPQGRA